MAPENRENMSASSVSSLVELPAEWLDTARRYAGVHQPVEPSQDFRSALHARLVAEAGRLQHEPVRAPRSGLLIPAAVGAAALSVLAGLALLGWRTRAIPTLLAHAQAQVRTAPSN